MSASADAITIDHVIFDELREFGDDFVAHLVAQFGLHVDPLLVQLADAVNSGDHAALAVIAHTIRGSGAQLGGRRLASSCARLEEKVTAGLPVGQNDLQDVAVEYERLRSMITHRLSILNRPLDPASAT
jgi:HPt (histidine-containing phosphotransfer) domain-containing protein